MAQVTGFLVKQSEKPTRNGGKIFSICVEVDGADEWFGFGFDAPTFGVDSEIEFDVEAKGEYENVINDSVVIINNVNPPAAPARKSRAPASKPARAPRGGAAAKPARTPRGGAAKEEAAPAKTERAAKKPDVDWDRKDRLIRAQSCQNTAVATIALAQAAGTLELPKKKALQWDALQALIEKETKRLFIKYDEVADECHDYGEGDADSAGADDGDYDDDGGIPE